MNVTSTISAVGIFGWPAHERRSDRYGVILLNRISSVLAEGSATLADLPTPTRVRVTATVLETRPSSHLGDIARGIAPSPAKRGETIFLGEGTAAPLEDYEISLGDIQFGIKLEPLDGREEDWFAPNLLYRLHDQTVRLDVEILEEPARELSGRERITREYHERTRSISDDVSKEMEALQAQFDDDCKAIRMRAQARSLEASKAYSEALGNLTE